MQLISMWIFALDQIYAYNFSPQWKLENTDIHIWTNTTSKNSFDKTKENQKCNC